MSYVFWIFLGAAYSSAWWSYAMLWKDYTDRWWAVFPLVFMLLGGIAHLCLVANAIDSLIKIVREHNAQNTEGSD